MLWVDLSNLSAGKAAFILPAALMVVVNLFSFSTAHQSRTPHMNHLVLESLLLLSVFLPALMSIPLEYRDGYADRVELDFASWNRRVFVRIISSTFNSLGFLFLVLLFLHFQNKFPSLTYDFDIWSTLTFIAAALLSCAVGTLVGSIIRNYNLATFLVSIIFFLELEFNISTQTQRSWTFTGLVVPLLSTHSIGLYFLNILKIAVPTLFVYAGLHSLIVKSTLRSRRKGEEESDSKSAPFKTSARGVWHPLRRLANVQRDMAVKVGQLITTATYMRSIPISLIFFGIFPLLSSKALVLDLPIQVNLPIIASMICTSLFSCIISIGSFSHTWEVKDREASLFRSVRQYQKFNAWVMCIVFTFAGLSIFIATFATIAFSHNSINGVGLFLRGCLTILVVLPVLVLAGTFITELKIDVRFFFLLAALLNVTEMTLASQFPASSPFLPSSLVAKLAGGAGLYVIADKQSPPSFILAVFLFTALLGVLLLVKRDTFWFKIHDFSEAPNTRAQDDIASIVRQPTVEWFE